MLSGQVTSVHYETSVLIKENGVPRLLQQIMCEPLHGHINNLNNVWTKSHANGVI